MKLKEFIDKFDNPEATNLADTTLAGVFSEEETPTAEETFERLAFSFGEFDQEITSPWGTYFGPAMSFTMSDGSRRENVSESQITQQAVEYWNSRRATVKNPLLAARYCGLVFEYGKSFGITPDSPLIDQYIDSLIAMVNGGYSDHALFDVRHVNRALSLALSSKDQPRVEAAKQCLINTMQRCECRSVGIWGRLLLSVKTLKTAFTTDEKAKVVAIAEEHLAQLISKPDPWGVQSAATALIDYFKGNKDKVKGYITKVEQSFKKDLLPNVGGLAATGNLEMLAKLYHANGFTQDAERVLAETVQYREAVQGDMQAHSISIPTDEETINQLMGDMLSEPDPIKAITGMVGKFTPSKDGSEIQLKSLAKHAPMAFMMPTQILDEKSRPTSIVLGIEDDLAGQLVLYISKLIGLNQVYLSIAIDRMVADGRFSHQNLCNYYHLSCLFETERLEYIDYVLSLYFDGKYADFSHQIVPQIENALRYLIERSGGSVIRSQQSGKGYTLKTMEALLRDEIAIKTFGEDLTNYLTILLVDQRGYNLRNRICHGNLFPLGREVADLLMHAFICVAAVRNSAK